VQPHERVPKKYPKSTQKATILLTSAKWHLIFEDFIKKEPLQNMQQSIKSQKSPGSKTGDFWCLWQNILITDTSLLESYLLFIIPLFRYNVKHFL
jgi:hypothetical protein